MCVFLRISSLILAAALLTALTPAQNPPAPTEPHPIRVSPGLIAALVTKKVVPEYPPDALAAGDHGKVVIEVIIGADGRVTQATPISGPASLQATSKAAAEQFEFRPYELNGNGVTVRTILRFLFSYKGSGAQRKGKVEYDSSAG